jgi:hypothetical protein
VKKILCAIVFFAGFLFPKEALAQQPIRVNCGGPAYTDSKGQLWRADTGFSGGHTSSTTLPLGGTADQTLYQTARYNNIGSEPLVYTFPVANGSYTVNLLFAEWNPSFENVGGRVFNVKMQGAPVLSNFDIFAEAGANAVLIKDAGITVSNGQITIEFDNVVQGAKIDAIEILPGSSGPALALKFSYPDGTPVAGTLAYTVTSSLLSFQGSVPLKNGQAQCMIYSNPSALGLSAQFQVYLSLTDTAGHTLWKFTVGMNPAQVNLGTVQSSALNVVVQKI